MALAADVAVNTLRTALTRVEHVRLVAFNDETYRLYVERLR